MGGDDKKTPKVAGQGVSLNFNRIPLGGKMLIGTTSDGKPLSLASVLERQWGLEDRQMGLMEDQFTANAALGAIQGATQIIGAFLQWDIMSDQMALQDRAMTLQEDIARHKMALDLDVVEKTDALANKQLTNTVELARIEKNRAVALAQVQADAKVEIAGKKAVASQFLASYNYGNPYRAVAV